MPPRRRSSRSSRPRPRARRRSRRSSRSPRRRASSSPTTTQRRPLTVAVTGGIGAGKSAALEAFARRGVPTSSSDAFVHRLLAEDERVRAALRERFGDSVFAEDGSVDRAALGRVVFADGEQLAFLEGLLHPLVAEEYGAWLEQVTRRPDPPAVVVSEIPLLFEAGRDAAFDRVVVVTAPAELRAGRSSVARDGRSRRLLPDEEKVRRADFAYVNEGTLEELDAFVAGVLERLTAGSA